MSATITIDNVNVIVSSIRKKLVDNLTDAQTMQELGKFVEARIKIRTSQHKDADGIPFLPYTKTYAKFRLSKGRGTKVNLLFTGRMLASIKGFVTGRGRAKVTIGERVKSVNNNKRRQFFAVNKKDALFAKSILLNRLRRGA